MFIFVEIKDMPHVYLQTLLLTGCHGN